MDIPTYQTMVARVRKLGEDADREIAQKDERIAELEAQVAQLELTIESMRENGHVLIEQFGRVCEENMKLREEWEGLDSAVKADPLCALDERWPGACKELEGRIQEELVGENARLREQIESLQYLLEETEVE